MRKHRTAAGCICLFFCAYLILLSFPFSAVAAEEIEIPSMKEASAVWFSHVESGILVASKQEAANVGAGSSVKVMSGLLLCEALSGRLGEQILLDDAIWEMASPKFIGHCLKLQRGDIISVKDLLYAAVCGSYNDAFYTLAVYLDGSCDAFLERMNRRGAELGMEHTRFEDATGVVSGSRTTAADMAKLVSVAYQNDLYMTLCQTVSYQFSSVKDPNWSFYNNNALVCQYQETKYYQKHCFGMSAGSSDDGNCVLTVAKHNNETYICVVLGGSTIKDGASTEQYGYRIVNRLVDWVYDTYTYMEIVSPNVDICTVPVTVSDMTSEVSLRTKETLSAYLPRTAELGQDIVYSIRLNDEALEAPFEEGTFAGYLAVIYDGRVLGTVKLYTAAGAERSGLISSLLSIQALTQNRAVVAGLLFFIVAITAWIVTEAIIRSRRRHRWDKYFSNKMEDMDVVIRSTTPDPDRLRKPPKQ